MSWCRNGQQCTAGLDSQDEVESNLGNAQAELSLKGRQMTAAYSCPVLSEQVLGSVQEPLTG